MLRTAKLLASLQKIVNLLKIRKNISLTKVTSIIIIQKKVIKLIGEKNSVLPDLIKFKSDGEVQM